MPRIWKLLPEKLPFENVTDGTVNCRSLKLSICRLERSSPVMAVTAMGTSWTEAFFFSAVTTTFSIGPSDFGGLSPCAAGGGGVFCASTVSPAAAAFAASARLDTVAKQISFKRDVSAACSEWAQVFVSQTCDIA